MPGAIIFDLANGGAKDWATSPYPALGRAAFDAAAETFAARLGALSKAGIDVEALSFEASYGRTTLEYYDGFVFGFYAEARPDLPPVATGGRYDALTSVLGGGAAVPAVGGVTAAARR